MSGNQHKDFNKYFNSVEDAINDIKEGKVIIVVDDENRENEGDFVAAAEHVTPEISHLVVPVPPILRNVPALN